MTYQDSIKHTYILYHSNHLVIFHLLWLSPRDRLKCHAVIEWFKAPSIMADNKAGSTYAIQSLTNTGKGSYSGSLNGKEVQPISTTKDISVWCIEVNVFRCLKRCLKTCHGKIVLKEWLFHANIPKNQTKNKAEHSSILVTHWGRVTHICVSKLTIIGSYSGLSPDRC